MSATIGVIGIGRMGRSICARLVDAGLPVIATDRDAEREEGALAAGARWLPGISDVVDAAEVLITVLPGAEALEEAAATVVPALRRETSWIEMTSAAPRDGAAVLARAEQTGADCLVATLGGGIDDARAGALQLFVGGRPAVVERHRPLLQTLGTIEHVGDHGAGYLAKLLVNFMWFAQGVALGEALVLAAREGVAPRSLLGAIARSAAGSELVCAHGEGLLRGDYLESYGLDRCCDQLDALVDLASQQGVPLELTATVRDAYRDALAHYGPVDGELLPVRRLQERAAEG